MTIPVTVDTFEHDIANEIRQKEASISDIATAVGDIGNTPPETSSPKGTSSSFMGIIIILIICGVIGASYAGYLYIINGFTPAAPVQTNTIQQQKVATEISVSSISTNIAFNIGMFLTNVKKTNAGYSIDITSYPPVFSYMIKNESKFGDEIALAIGNSHTLKSVSTSTLETASTTNATSTISTASTTLATTTIKTNATTTDIQKDLPTSYTFSDVTISNQNMRVATSIYGTVVYAFIGTQKLVISSSTEGILTLRSNILKK